MNDLRAKFLQELVDFIRSKLNAHIAKAGGLAEFINGYLRIPCGGEPHERDLAAQTLTVRRQQLEDRIGCPLFSVQIAGLRLEEGMKPVWTIIVQPHFNSINESVIECFVIEVGGRGYTLLEVREKSPLRADAMGWGLVLNELRIESTLDALKKTEPPAT